MRKKKTKSFFTSRNFLILFAFGMIAILLILVSSILQKQKQTTHTKASEYNPAPLAIIGGTQSKLGAHPYIVSLYNKSLIEMGSPDHYAKHFCGGALIDKDWILTAAHCVNTTSASGVGVVFNMVDLKLSSETSNRRKGSKIIIHKDYVPTYTDKPSKSNNDIALIKLNKSFTGITPITLNKKALSTYLYKATTMGWGYTSLTTPGTKSPYLMEGEVTIENLSSYPLVLHSKGSPSPYSYDSGGPLVSKDGITEILVGINSSSTSNASDAYYVDVSDYIGWINGETGLSL